MKDSKRFHEEQNQAVETSTTSQKTSIDLEANICHKALQRLPPEDKLSCYPLPQYPQPVKRLLNNIACFSAPTTRSCVGIIGTFLRIVMMFYAPTWILILYLTALAMQLAYQIIDTIKLYKSRKDDIKKSPPM